MEIRRSTSYAIGGGEDVIERIVAVTMEAHMTDSA